MIEKKRKGGRDFVCEKEFEHRKILKFASGLEIQSIFDSIFDSGRKQTLHCPSIVSFGHIHIEEAEPNT